ncbi:MAG: RDD family protein [Candidatus Onthovivens sp.]|nr:RDD family protein [Candidatus Onthovivens sp.]
MNKKIYKPKVSLRKDRRFFSSLIDFLLSLILGIILFEACFFPLFSSKDEYKNLENEANNYRISMNKIYSDSKLVMFDEDNMPLDDEQLFLTFIDNVKNKEETCLQYFYCTYLSEKDDKYKECDIYWYNTNILGLPKTDDDFNYSYYFDYQVNSLGKRLYNEVAIFNNERGFYDNLSLYLDGKIIESTQEAYQGLYNFFDKRMSNARSIIKESEEYQTYYNEYRKVQSSLSSYFSYASMISYTISLTIIYLIIPSIIKYKRTIGEVICKIKTIKDNGEELSFLRNLSRNLLRMLSLFSFLCLMPLFRINFFLLLSLPIIKINNFGFNVVILLIITVVFLLTDLFMMIYQKDNKSLVGFITRTKTISFKSGEYEVLEENK